MKNLFSIMPELLRDPDAFFQNVQRDDNIKGKALTLFYVSIFSFMIYGFMIGLAKSPLQAVSSALKIPILFLSTMAFCLPALYFFSLALLGTPLRMIQVLTVVLFGISVTHFCCLDWPCDAIFVLTSTNYAFSIADRICGVEQFDRRLFSLAGMTSVETTQDDNLTSGTAS
jgi:hypothetical protein